MKRENAGALLLAAASALLAAGCVLNPGDNGGTKPTGELVTIGDTRILRLNGSHFERGYQHGFLAGDLAKRMHHELLLLHLFEGNDSLYEFARGFFRQHFRVEPKYWDEARGIVQGMLESGAGLYDTLLHRTIDTLDILLLSSIEELFNVVELNFGCSSLSSWGSATQSDTALKGELIITRHWDYPRFGPMIDGVMLVAHHPSEPSEQNWVGVSWAGTVGSLTAMNDSGVGAFLNYGTNYNNYQQNPNLSQHHPVSLSVRNAIEGKDYNRDGACTAPDVVAAVKEYVPCFGSIIHVVSSTVKDSFALLVESDNEKGVMIRTAADNTMIAGNNLAATNHYRLLYPPIACERYSAIAESLSVSDEVGFDRNWNILAGAAASSHCIFSILYVPSTGHIRWAVTTSGDPRPAYERPSRTLSVDELLARQSGQ